MNAKWIFIILFSITTSFLQAQTDLINGTIITLQGETLAVKIKPAKTDKLAKGISIMNDSTQEFTKLTYKEISYFKYENSEYFAKKESEEGKTVFMERTIDGPAQLYTYNHKVDKGNDKVDVVDYYVEKRDEGKFQQVIKKSFKNDMSEFFKDNGALYDKIQGSYYDYDEKDAAVEEYNDWVAQGKPGKTWRKEDGNYTKENGNDNNTNNNNNSNNNNNNFINPNTIYDGSKFGIDIPLLADYSIINSDLAVTAANVKNTSNGFGYNLGIGLRWQLSKSVFWRNGFNFRTKRFHSNYAAQDTSGNLYSFDEYGNLHYFGFYSTMHLEFGNFILGGGFEFTYAYFYRANYSIKNSSGQVVNIYPIQNSSGGLISGAENQSNSVIALNNNFNVQFDMNLILGYKIRLANGACNIKPIFQYTVPLVSMFDLAPPQLFNRTGVHGFLVSLGVIIDVGFPKRPKPKSLLED